MKGEDICGKVCPELQNRTSLLHGNKISPLNLSNTLNQNYTPHIDASDAIL